MSADNFTRTQIVRKAVVPTRGGVVAAQHRRAAAIGAAVLEQGSSAQRPQPSDVGHMFVSSSSQPAPSNRA